MVINRCDNTSVGLFWNGDIVADMDALYGDGSDWLTVGMCVIIGTVPGAQICMREDIVGPQFNFLVAVRNILRGGS
jgi:hypothetical protein